MAGIKKLLGLEKPRLTREELAEQAKIASANDFINVADIRGNFLYSKDGYVFMYLRIEPVSLDLLPESEKMKKVRLFASEFAGERENFKFFSISRPVDISNVTAYLSDLLAKSEEAAQKDLIKQEIRAVSNFALTEQVIERQFFLVIWERHGLDAEAELKKRGHTFMQKFQNCELRAEIAEQNSIVQLCNLFANPAYAHLEDTEFSAALPFLTKRGSERS